VPAGRLNRPLKQAPTEFKGLFFIFSFSTLLHPDVLFREYFPVSVRNVKEMPLALNEFFPRCGLLLHLEFIPLLYGLQWSQNTSDYTKRWGKCISGRYSSSFKSRDSLGQLISVDDFTQTTMPPRNSCPAATCAGDQHCHLHVTVGKSREQ